MFHKFKIIWRPLFKFEKHELYWKINIYKPRLEILTFENSSFDHEYKESYWIGWFEIRIRRRNVY